MENICENSTLRCSQFAQELSKTRVLTHASMPRIKRKT